MRPRIDFSTLLDGTKLPNWGAKAFLAGRRTERRTPFIPIQLFGFVLDEPGPNEGRPGSGGARALPPLGEANENSHTPDD